MKYPTRIMWLVVLCLSSAAWGVAQGERKTTADASPSLPPVIVAQNPEHWKEFNSVAGRFAVSFPGTPAEETQAVGGADAALEVRSYTLRWEGAEYAVAYVDYPIPVNNSLIAGQVLDNVAGAELEDAARDSSSMTEIALEGHPGRFLKLTLADGRTLRNKMYMVGKRLYQITFTRITPTLRGEKDTPLALSLDEAMAAKFFASFKLLRADWPQ